MDKIDRVIKIISEAKVTSSEDRPSSSSPQDAAKQRALAQREKQKKLLGKIKERQADRKKYVPQKPLKNISKSIKRSKFSKLTKVSDEGKTGVTAMGQTVGNVAKAGAAVAKNVVKGAAKAAVAAGNIKSGMERRKLVGLERNRLKANIKQREAKKTKE